jgi:hypothetical protein
MEAIRDLSWMRQLALSSVERTDLHGYPIAIVSVPPTTARHAERFRYRLLAFDPALGKPILSVDLESDILGDFCLSIEAGQKREVLARYDAPPSMEDFRSRALAEAASRLPATPRAPKARRRPSSRAEKKS